jgi:hypothetical protein
MASTNIHSWKMNSAAPTRETHPGPAFSSLKIELIIAPGILVNSKPSRNRFGNASRGLATKRRKQRKIENST